MRPSNSGYTMTKTLNKLGQMASCKRFVLDNENIGAIDLARDLLVRCVDEPCYALDIGFKDLGYSRGIKALHRQQKEGLTRLGRQGLQPAQSFRFLFRESGKAVGSH